MRSRAVEDIYKWPIRSLQIPGNYAIFPKLFYGSCRTSILISQNLIFLALPCSSCFQRCLPRLIIAYATNHSLRAPPTDHISNWHIWSSRMPKGLSANSNPLCDHILVPLQMPQRSGHDLVRISQHSKHSRGLDGWLESCLKHHSPAYKSRKRQKHYCCCFCFVLFLLDSII